MPLRPLHFREVKKRLEAAGFVEVSSKGSHINSPAFPKEAPGSQLFRAILKYR